MAHTPVLQVTHTLCKMNQLQHLQLINTQFLLFPFPALVATLKVPLVVRSLSMSKIFLLSSLPCTGKTRGYLHRTTIHTEDLLSIHVDHVYHHFKHRVNGDPTTNEGSTPHIHFRLHSVWAWKRSIT